MDSGEPSEPQEEFSGDVSGWIPNLDASELMSSVEVQSKHFCFLLCKKGPSVTDPPHDCCSSACFACGTLRESMKSPACCLCVMPGFRTREVLHHELQR